MLFLKAYDGADLKNIDSCDIVHGEFRFTGTLDSTRLVTLFMDDEGLMPVVLEKGEILIKIDNTQQKVSGTPLNEKLFKFIEKYKQPGKRGQRAWPPAEPGHNGRQRP